MYKLDEMLRWDCLQVGKKTIYFHANPYYILFVVPLLLLFKLSFWRRFEKEHSWTARVKLVQVTLMLLFRFYSIICFCCPKVVTFTRAVPDSIHKKKIILRLVTKGDQPAPVEEAIRLNLREIKKSQICDFCNVLLEVVTDRKIDALEQIMNDTQFDYVIMRQIVVPDSYSTSSGATKKARALQFALDCPVTNDLDDDDCIIHLDEDTVIGRQSYCFIRQFMLSKEYDTKIAQGMLNFNYFQSSPSYYSIFDNIIRSTEQLSTYATQPFWSVIQKMHGSFFIIKLKNEKLVSWNMSAKQSQSEDFSFIKKANQLSLSYMCIPGIAHEKSPSRFSDIIVQRSRWKRSFLVSRYPWRLCQLALLLNALGTIFNVKYHFPYVVAVQMVNIIIYNFMWHKLNRRAVAHSNVVYAMCASLCTGAACAILTVFQDIISTFYALKTPGSVFESIKK